MSALVDLPILFRLQPLTGGCIIAGSVAVPLMQCPICGKLLLYLPILKG